MARRWLLRSAVGVCLWAAGCTSLRDLDSYENGSPASSPQTSGSSGGGLQTIAGMGGVVIGGTAGGGTGGASGTEAMGGNLAGAGGEAGAPEPPVCGDGTVDAGEACDDGGPSGACTDLCKVRVCPPEFVCQYVEGRYLALHQTTKTWTDAEIDCESQGMTLTLPQTDRENFIQRAWAAHVGVVYSWLGATDSQTEGEWLDLSGKPLFHGTSASGNPEPGRYTNFNPGEPNNCCGGQDCLNMFAGGTWDDDSCANVHPYVCTPSVTVAASCGNKQVDAGEYCDTGQNTKRCDQDCTKPVCGDGLVNQAAGEQCDDGNLDPLDGCDATCQDTGMVARWRLDEHIGRIAFDTGSYKYHGDLQGGANFQDGFGLPLDGTSDYVSVSISKTLNVIGKITLMALVKPNLPLADGYHDIIGHNSPGKETWLRFNGGTLQGGSWDGSEGLVAFNVNWQIVNWHHVAARYNGTRWSFLLDGLLVASADTNKGAQDIEGPWEIGGRSDGRYLAGSIADVRVYDRDLDNDTILAIAKAGLKAANTP